MNKDSTLLIRINSDLKQSIQEIANKYNISVSEIINCTLLDIARKGDLNIMQKSKLGLYRYDGADSILNIPQIKKAVEESILESNLEDKINKVYLYGSFSRNEAKKNSDIDLRLEAKNNLSMFDIGNIRYLIKEKTGRDVDISNEDTDKLDPLFYENVRKDEVCIYERKGSANSSQHSGTS